MYDGDNYVHVRVLPTANCSLGEGYSFAITRAEGAISSPRPNRPAVGLPVIPAYGGSPSLGYTMDTDVFSISDRDGFDRATFSYQWLADDAEITGATGSSYTVANTELGKALKVRVSFTDNRGTEETLTSAATKVVRLPNSDPVGKPVILGTLEVGQTLRADVSGISDQNGMTNATFSYEWVNFYGPVKDGEEYTLVDRDAGRCGCWLIVIYTDDAGHEERVHGEPIGVAPRPNSPATGAPTITGTARVGETLTANTSGIADTDGLGGATFSYQWIANDGTPDTDITDATDSTYTLIAADQGKYIRVRVSFADDKANQESIVSVMTAAAAAQSSPAINGTAQVGETLTVDTYGMASGLVRAAYSCQWVANDGTSDTDITGATNSTYTLVPDDEGKTIKAQVTFTNDAGNEETRTSPATAAVADRPNSPASGAPVITGTAQVGQTLTADTTGIADDDGLSDATFGYQWLADDAEITGSTDSTYTLLAAAEGKTIKVQVSFTDDADNEETLTSGATAAVAGAVPAQVDSESPSYITVVVSEDTSDPNNIVTNFTVTWSDTDDCSTNYNAYLNIESGLETAESQLHLGFGASGGTQITKGLTGVEGFFDVEMYCGTDGSGRLVSRVAISSSYERPKPGTYSSEPPLNALSVSHGTLTPIFNSYTSSYTVPDVANDVTRTTITATPKTGYAVDFFEASDGGVFAVVVEDLGGSGGRGRPGLSSGCDLTIADRLGPLFELTDADPNTAGFQVDLYDGDNYVYARAYPTGICNPGKGYRLAITRAEGSVSSTRPNRPATGLPTTGLNYPNRPPRAPRVGYVINADVSIISDRDGFGQCDLQLSVAC